MTIRGYREVTLSIIYIYIYFFENVPKLYVAVILGRTRTIWKYFQISGRLGRDVGRKGVCISLLFKQPGMSSPLQVSHKMTGWPFININICIFCVFMYVC